MRRLLNLVISVIAGLALGIATSALADRESLQAFVVATGGTFTQLLGNASGDSQIFTNTSDGSDNRALALSGGGNSGTDRGAILLMYGNEHASQAGRIYLYTGNVSTGNLLLNAQNTSATVQLMVGGSAKWTINNTGEMLGAGTSTIGWAVVDGTDNTACSSQCTSPAVFGFNLAAGATAPVIVGPSDATADICLCAGAS